jgi:ATP-binding cassette subfamily C protein CydC
MSATHTHGNRHDVAPGGLVARFGPMLRLLEGHRRILGVAVLGGIANHLFLIASAALGALIVGRALTGAPAAELRGPFALLLVLVVPMVVAPWLETQLAHVVAYRVLVDLRGRVYRAFERMSPGELLQRRAGDLGSTAISDVELLESFFAHTLSPLVSAAVVPAAAVAVLAVIDVRVALAMVPVLVVLATLPTWLRRRAEADGRAVRGRLGELNAEAVDALQGLREILTHGAGDREEAELRERGRILDLARRRHAGRAGREASATDLVVTGGVLLALVVAGALVGSGELGAELLPATVVLAAMSLAPVTALVDVAREVGVVGAAAARVLALLDTPRAVPEPARPADVTGAAPVVTFEDVRFRYAPGLPEAVRGVSFSVRPGQTVALVGHSGAGKSTCAHLLLRLWDVDAGEIRIGGHDARSIRSDDLRRLVAYVPQDVHLFNTTIAENLALGRPDASRAEVEAAARAALAHDFVAALPEGYDTVAGELGNVLSGGQRQRLAIARALVADTPILVLDEAVSNLDAESEQELAESLRTAGAGRTTLVIAHRLSTILTADHVVMLRAGEVVETGSPRELLAAGGPFAGLVQTQYGAP